MLTEAFEKIKNYLNNYKSSCYTQFGEKTGNDTPAFSMEILPADKYGHLK